MKAKVWITLFSVVSLLLLGAAGFVCFFMAQKHSKSLGSWGNKKGIIRSLEKKVPYPNKSNVDALESQVTEYNKKVEELFVSLNKFQQPLNKELTSEEFQQLVTERVTVFRELAKSKDFEVLDGDSFKMGFDAYSRSTPTQSIVPIIHYELKAIEHLLSRLVNAGADSLSVFSRDLIPGEVGGPEKQDISTVHKYPVRMEFRTNHAAFRSFINSISNDTEYFYIIRVLNVANENPEGPLKGNQGLSRGPSFVKKDTGEPAGIEDLTKWGYPNASDLELAAAAEADGFISSGRDARVLMGQEKLDVFMVIDIVRFLDPSEVKAAETQSSSSSRGQRRRG